MRVTAKVLAVKDDLAKIKIASQKNPLKVGEAITVRKGSQRTGNQNALYWVYLSWLIKEGGLKAQGHFSPDALHEDLKAYFLSEKKYDKGMFKVLMTESTADLTKSEFGTYFDEVDKFVVSFFGVNTQPFWDTYQDAYKM